MIIFENSTEHITIQDCLDLYDKGICTIVTDGKDVSFCKEKEPIRSQTK